MEKTPSPMAHVDPADKPNSTDSRRGFCYLLTHPEMQVVKIGSTRKHPIQRATELSAGTGVPGQFTVAYWAAAEDCFEVEGLCHDRFADRRVDPAREFFRVGIAEVVSYVREVLGGPSREGGEWIEGGGGQVLLEQDLPWSVLFASFPDDGSDRSLTEDERAQCRQLEGSGR